MGRPVGLVGEWDKRNGVGGMDHGQEDLREGFRPAPVREKRDRQRLTGQRKRADDRQRELSGMREGVGWFVRRGRFGPEVSRAVG